MMLELPSFQIMTAVLLTSTAFLLTVGEVAVRWLLPGEPWDPKTRTPAKAPPATCRLNAKKSPASEDPELDEAPSSLLSPRPSGAATRNARSPHVTPGGSRRRSSQPGIKKRAAVVESWLAELLEALSLDAEDNTAGFGFVVSTSKAPKPSDLPRLIVKSASLRSVRTGEALLTVDGVRVAGMTARKVKDLVSKASLRLRLSVLADVGEQARDVVLWRGRVGAVVALWEAIQRYDGRTKTLPEVEPPQPLELQLRATLQYFTDLLADLDEKEPLRRAIKAKHASSAGLERAILALISSQLLASHPDADAENLSPGRASAKSPARQPLKESFAQVASPEIQPYKYQSPDKPSLAPVGNGGGAAAHAWGATPPTPTSAQRALVKEASFSPTPPVETMGIDVCRGSTEHISLEYMHLMGRYNVLLKCAREELEEKDGRILDLQSRCNILLQSARLAGRDVGSSAFSSKTPSGHSSDAECGARGPCVSVMRHGQRLDEVDEGWVREATRPYDPPLTETGRHQAFERGIELGEGRGADVVVCSPFLRCLQTAQEVIRGLQATAKREAAPRLHVDFGLCEVHTSRNMHGTAPTLLQRKDLEPELQSLVASPEDCTLCAPGGDRNNSQGGGCTACLWGGGVRAPAFPESLDQAAARYREAFGRVAALFPGREVLCVAHGDTVAQFAAETRGVSKDDVYEVPHCSMVSGSKVGGGPWRRGDIVGNIGILAFD